MTECRGDDEHTKETERPQTLPLLFYVRSSSWSPPWFGCQGQSRCHRRLHGISGNLSGSGTRRPPFEWHSWLDPGALRPTDCSRVRSCCHCPRSRWSMSPDGRGDDRHRNGSHLHKIKQKSNHVYQLLIKTIKLNEWVKCKWKLKRKQLFVHNINILNDTDDRWFSVHHHQTWHHLPLEAGRSKERLIGVVCGPPGQAAGGQDAMFQAIQFPAGICYLYTSLSNVYLNDFTLQKCTQNQYYFINLFL